MRSLDAVLLGLGVDLEGWILDEANGISGDGSVVVGYGTNPDGFAEAWIATIPEPGTGLLLMTGLLGLASCRRGRVQG